MSLMTEDPSILYFTINSLAMSQFYTSLTYVKKKPTFPLWLGTQHVAFFPSVEVSTEYSFNRSPSERMYTRNPESSMVALHAQRRYVVLRSDGRSPVRRR